ncbi:MAG: biotin transporter BioY [Phycisphaerales bacterium]
MVSVLAGHLVIFAIGVPWLAVVRVQRWRAIEAGFTLRPGLIVKTALAVVEVQANRRAVGVPASGDTVRFRTCARAPVACCRRS